ncbi:MAG: carbon storage regulator [Lawsonibacter sp.]|nr:carbon storage regulator [Lawsonibacter sp.]
MLCISMRTGEYFTVGGDTMIPFDHLYGDRTHMAIHAPREIPIVRGAAHSPGFTRFRAG